MAAQMFSEDDDLDLCLYYLRSLHNVLKCTGNTSWAIMGSKHVAVRDERLHVSSKSTELICLSFANKLQVVAIMTKLRCRNILFVFS